MFKFLTFLLIFGIYQCEKPEIKSDEILKGDWTYVGTFSETQNYSCYVCSDFDINKSLYKISFIDGISYTAKINLLLAKGDYSTSFDKNSASKSTGTFENLNLEILNKPYETAEDSKFKTLFSEATNFSIVLKTNDKAYDQLTLSSNNNEFLLFVRK